MKVGVIQLEHSFLLRYHAFSSSDQHAPASRQDPINIATIVLASQGFELPPYPLPTRDLVILLGALLLRPRNAWAVQNSQHRVVLGPHQVRQAVALGHGPPLHGADAVQRRPQQAVGHDGEAVANVDDGVAGARLHVSPTRRWFGSGGVVVATARACG